MSGFLFDTNIPSETVKPRPVAQPNQTICILAITIDELRRGFVTLPPSEAERRERLEQWLERDVMPWFNERILPITTEIADRWA